MIGSVVSWTPLAADYTRFAKSRRGAGLGAGLGYFVPTVWCVDLGILIVLARHVSDAQALPAAVAAAGGIAFAALIAITIDESEKAFADIYSTAVSLQSFLPRLSQRLLITLVSLLATGSFFVPLLGVLVADWLVAGARYTPERIFEGAGWRPNGLVAWLAGFMLYQWLSPVGPGWWTSLVARTHPGNVTFTASLPSFGLAFLLTAALTLAARATARRHRAACT